MRRHLLTPLLVPVVAATLAAGLAAAPAAAQDAQRKTYDPAIASGDVAADSITVGAALVYLPDYEGSNDYRFVPAPGAVGSFKGYGFTLAGNRASIDLIRNKPGPVWDIQAGPIGVVNFNRSSTGSIDDVRVKALGKRGTAIELGGYVGLSKTGVITSPYDQFTVSLSYRYDVAGVHSSGILQPSVNYLTPLSRKAAVGFFASAEHAERGYATTYFSVSPAQSLASGLPVYTARGGWKDWSVGAIATYSLTGDLLHGVKAVAGGTYSRQLNSFADTPLVSIAGSRDQWIGAVGLAYTF